MIAAKRRFATMTTTPTAAISESINPLNLEVEKLENNSQFILKILIISINFALISYKVKTMTFMEKEQRRSFPQQIMSYL